MKNPTEGNMSIMLNAIFAAQNSHTFIYRGWEVKIKGNTLAHAILRGYVDRYGNSTPNSISISIFLLIVLRSADTPFSAK